MSTGADSRYLFSIIRERMRAHTGPLLDFAFGRSEVTLPDDLRRIVRDGAQAAVRRCSVEETEAMIDAAVRWLDETFDVRVDPAAVLPVPGGRAAMSALTTALIEPGDAVLVTEPGYPAFERLARQAHADVVGVAQNPHRGFEPALDRIDSDRIRRLRVIALNYPNNPTGAVPTENALDALGALGGERCVVFNDAVYGALTFGDTAFSLLAAASSIGTRPRLELHSLAKLLPLGPMSTAFLAGDATWIEQIRRYSEFAWTPASSLQMQLGRASLEQTDRLRAIRDDVRTRLEQLAQTLAPIGFELFEPAGGQYLLTRSPAEISGRRVHGALQAAELLLERHGLAVVPFELPPDHYLRFSSLYSTEDLKKLQRLELTVQP